MSEPRTLDVGSLAPGAFGSRSLMWWGTMGIVLIEGIKLWIDHEKAEYVAPLAEGLAA